MCHPFFDELRVEGARMPNGKDFPVLFNFTREGESFALGMLSATGGALRASFADETIPLSRMSLIADMLIFP